MANYVVVALDRFEPTVGSLMTELPQPNGKVALKRTFIAPEPQDDGSMKPSNILSIQKDGSVGWRPETNPIGPFELAQVAPGFYLYGPGILLDGDTKEPVYAFPRFPEFTT